MSAVNSNNKRPMPELDTDSEDIAENGLSASLTMPAPSMPLRSSRGKLMLPSATIVRPLRQQTILPFLVHGKTDIMSRPDDASGSVGATLSAGELSDKYPQFKAREFKLELGQKSKTIGTDRYHICKSITTVPDVLQEWRHGLHGRPSIQILNNTFKATWRYSDDRTMYEARRGVVKAYIRLVMMEGHSNTEAIESLERKRRTRAIVTLYNELKKAAPKTENGAKSSVYGKDEPEYSKDLMNQAERVSRPPPIEETKFPLPVRQINSIPNIWKEWELGWNGAPSIKSLIAMHGRAWNNPRFKAYETHFRCRNQLIRTIREAVKQRAASSHADAIRVLEDIRGTREPSTFCKSDEFKSPLKDKWRITTAVEEWWKCGKY